LTAFSSTKTNLPNTIQFFQRFYQHSQYSISSKIIMSSATTYTAHIQEFKKDREQLEANGYRLQLAKAVSTDGALPTSNVVYASRILAPDMSITWEENYGFNWVQDMSKPGAKVTYSGEWVAVKLGETFNLDKTGGWVKQNGTASDPNALNIGSNDYKIPVHIIVGVKTADKVTPQNPQGWTPVSYKAFV
jgi:hypothetical protein